MRLDVIDRFRSELLAFRDKIDLYLGELDNEENQIRKEKSAGKTQEKSSIKPEISYSETTGPTLFPANEIAKETPEKSKSKYETFSREKLAETHSKRNQKLGEFRTKQEIERGLRAITNTPFLTCPDQVSDQKMIESILWMEKEILNERKSQ